MISNRNPAMTLLSQTLAFLIPITLGVFWPVYSANPVAVSMAVRITIAGMTALLALLWFGAPLTRAELKFFTLVFGFCIVTLVPSLTASNIPRALTGWTKLVILCSISLALSRSLRHRGTAAALGWAMLIASMVLSVYIISVYVHYIGWALPSYRALRIMKEIANTKASTPLNPIASSALFAYILGICLIRPSRLILVLGVAVFIVTSMLSGSRAPTGIVILCGIVLVTIKLLRMRHLAVRVTVLAAILTVGVVLFLSSGSLDRAAIGAFTEGRSDLWTIAWTKFLERPLTGYGFESWRDDLVSRLPDGTELTGDTARHLEGGYHNEYFTLLAEQGLAVFVLGIIIMWTLLSSCCHLTFALGSRNAQPLFFACLFLVFRAVVEVPGLFGYAQEPFDYLAYCFMAIVISRLSLAEDRLRTTAAPVWNRGPNLPSRREFA